MSGVAWARGLLESMSLASLPGLRRPKLVLLQGRPSDTALVARAILGGPPGKQAEDELYRRHRTAVTRLVQSFGDLDRDECEDVVQDAFVRAFRALGTLKERDRFAPWLFTIARNRARSFLTSRASHRRAAEEATRQTLLLGDHVPAASSALEKEVEARAVRDVIEGLREGPEKETVRLFYLEGTLSAREIAQRMGVGKSAVTMRLERFRAKVKDQLTERLRQAG